MWETRADSFPADPRLGAAAAAGAALQGDGSSLASSSWRYAPMAQSTDSEGFLNASAPAAGAEAAVPAAGDPWRAASPPAGSAAFTPGAEPDRQLWSPSKRPAQHMAAAPPCVQHPQQQQLGGGGSSGVAPAFGHASAAHLAPPPGVDPASYAAGERAALMMAFQQALPGQQALGQLFSAVDALHARLEGEARAWRSLQLGASKADGLLEGALQRLDALEHSRLPALQEKWEETARRAPEQLTELVGSLQQVVSLLAQQRQLLLEHRQQAEHSGSSGGSGLLAKRRIPWLLLAAAGYGQSLLSKADVAALFLSRKILLAEPTPGELEAEDAAARRRRRLRSALGAALFVAAVESAWQAQRRLLRPLPAAAQRVAAPLQLGLRAARAAVWSAGLLLAAAQTRASCVAAGDSIVGALEAAAAAVRLPAWAQALPLWRRQQQTWASQLLCLESGRQEQEVAAASCGARAQVTTGQAAPGTLTSAA
ncbi:hypothetical protein ABPG75_009211 [Micractinium tetrahymenae]